MAKSPVRYSDELAQEICERLAAGESLNAICQGESMPDESAVRAWVIDNKHDFAPKYTRAREIQMERFADEIIRIADDGSNDTYRDEEGREKIDYDNIKRSTLRIDTRKWLMSKIIPKKWGEKQHVEHSGGIDLTLDGAVNVLEGGE